MNTLRATKLNEPSPEAVASPYHSLLPTSEIGNLKWRAYVLERTATDLDFRAAIKQACKEDICFFAETLCWLHETRPIVGQEVGAFPVKLTADQVDLLYWLVKYGGRIDIVWSKSRGIGASWLLCVYVMWMWLFQPGGIDIAMVSKDSESLDLPNRPTSLLGKLDLLFARLPFWLRFDETGASILGRTHTHHRFVNQRNNNSVIGYEATDEKLRSGRYFLVILDEAATFPMDIQKWLAAALGTTFSVIWVSTHKGTANMFYRLSVCEDPQVKMVRIEHWFWTCPRLWKGAYIVKNGRVEILDKDYAFPPDYFSALGKVVYEFEGKIRSLYVDDWMTRPGSDKQMIYEELYGIAAADSRKFYSKVVMQIARSGNRRPMHIGHINESLRWVEDLDGDIHLWTSPSTLNSRYCIGCDPSLGTLTGAYSGLAAIDEKTGEIILAARFTGLDAVQLARTAERVAKFLAGARGLGYVKINFESTGINVGFTNEIRRLRYPNVWCHKDDKLGYPNKDAGGEILLEMGRAIRDGELMVGDERVAEDMAEWEYNDKMDLVFAGVDGHGDLGMATAYAWWAAKEKRRAFIASAEYNSRNRATGFTIDPKKIELAARRRRKQWGWQYSRNGR